MTDEIRIAGTTKKGELLFLSNGNLIGIAARKLQKNEIIKYIPLADTEDVLASKEAIEEILIRIGAKCPNLT